MREPPHTRPGGAAGVLFLFCAAAGGAALAFDLIFGAHGFWPGAQPGGRALIGVGAAALAILASRLARAVLARRERGKGSRHAGDHP